jgi:hypothetical protein
VCVCSWPHLYVAAQTPLQVAASAGHTDCVRALLTAGADVYAVDGAGHSALQLAQMAAQTDTAIVLIEAVRKCVQLCALYEYSTAQKNKMHLFAICAIVSPFSKLTVQQHIELEQACVDGDTRKCERVLALAADSRLVDAVLNGGREEEYTPLYRAAERGRDVIVGCVCAAASLCTLLQNAHEIRGRTACAQCHLLQSSVHRVVCRSFGHCTTVVKGAMAIVNTHISC